MSDQSQQLALGRARRELANRYRDISLRINSLAWAVEGRFNADDDSLARAERERKRFNSAIAAHRAIMDGCGEDAIDNLQILEIIGEAQHSCDQGDLKSGGSDEK